MATFDIFNSDAFSMVEMLDAIERVPYTPQYLGSLNIFTPRPVRTVTVAVEDRDGVLSIIQTTPRGAPLPQRTDLPRKIRDFRIPRVAKGDRLNASEIQSIRAFGAETEVMQAQAEVARRLSGPWGLQNDMEITWENMRLGALQGVVLDADGSTIYDWFDEWDATQAAEIDFDLDAATPASGVVRKKCNQVVRQMMTSAKGAWTPATRVYSIVGDAFWDDLTAHVEVRQTYLNTAMAAELRGGNAYESFMYGGINWINYRGTDDGTTIAVGTDKAKFFPVGASGVFQVAYAPAETFEFVNTPGRPLYPMIIPDRERQMYIDIELYSYPLFICTHPLMLQRGKRT